MDNTSTCDLQMFVTPGSNHKLSVPPSPGQTLTLPLGTHQHPATDRHRDPRAATVGLAPLGETPERPAAPEPSPSERVLLSVGHWDTALLLARHRAREQQPGRHRALTAFGRLLTQGGRLISKIRIYKAIQLAKLSASKVLLVQDLAAEQTDVPFSRYVTRFHSDQTAADLEVYALNPNLISNPYTLHGG